MRIVFLLMAGGVLLGVLGVLVLGVTGMFRGSPPARSNKLMQYRVALQFLAVVLMLLAMVFAGRS